MAFWQEFTFKILNACGIETPTKIPVSNIEIKVFGAHRLPEIIVTFSPYKEGEFKTIVETFQAAGWKNTRE